MDTKEKRIQQSWCGRAARRLRDKATRAELVFRIKLLDAGFLRFDFQKYFRDENEIAIADFYLRDKRIVIEIDGSIHDKPEVILNDLRKDKMYKRIKYIFAVIHINNKQAFRMDISQIRALINGVKDGEILYCY